MVSKYVASVGYDKIRDDVKAGTIERLISTARSIERAKLKTQSVYPRIKSSGEIEKALSPLFRERMGSP